MSSKTICPICYDNIGKIHRELHCGHKFHHKCLKQCERKDTTIQNCPYCRQDYENIILRDRTYLLSISEKQIKTNFITFIKKKLYDCEMALGKKNKLLIVNGRYGFTHRFTYVVKQKINENFNEIQDLYKKGEIKSEYEEFCNYRNVIINKL